MSHSSPVQRGNDSETKAEDRGRQSRRILGKRSGRREGRRAGKHGEDQDLVDETDEGWIESEREVTKKKNRKQRQLLGKHATSTLI